jgi:hypothetical protein
MMRKARAPRLAPPPSGVVVKLTIADPAAHVATMRDDLVGFLARLVDQRRPLSRALHSQLVGELTQLRDELHDAEMALETLRPPRGGASR